MVVRRRSALLGVVAGASVVVALAYLWRVGHGGGLLPLIVAAALVLVAVVHGIAWRESRLPALTADMTGIQVRLGGGWTLLPWGDVERLDVHPRRRLGDGRITVHPRDERRTLGDADLRCRLALGLNRWLYDAALPVPFGLTSTVSVDDVPGTLQRLADGRAEVVVVDGTDNEPAPTVEIAEGRAAAPKTTAPSDDERVTAPSSGAPGRGTSPPRRLASVVSALRMQAGRRAGQVVASVTEPPTAGALALAHDGDLPRPVLPEAQELRRRAPEDETPDVVEQAEPASPAPSPPATVLLRIDATTDVSAQTMRQLRSPWRPTSEPAAAPTGPAQSAAPTEAAATADFETPAGRDPGIGIGAPLREARQWLGISVDELAERTRIRPVVIEAIENDDFSPCGGDFYARGHLRMLTAALGIEPGPVLARYDDRVAGDPVSARAVFDAGLSRRVVRPDGAGPRWGTLIGTVVVLLLAWCLALLLSSRGGSHGIGTGNPPQAPVVLASAPISPSSGGSSVARRHDVTCSHRLPSQCSMRQ